MSAGPACAIGWTLERLARLPDGEGGELETWTALWTQVPAAVVAGGRQCGRTGVWGHAARGAGGL